MTFVVRNNNPPSRGSRDCAVTAENVVNPAQNPGSKSKRNSVTPRRSMNTSSMAARATPIKFAANVPNRSSGNTSPKPNRDRVPATPPAETRAKDFRASVLSCRN